MLKKNREKAGEPSKKELLILLPGIPVLFLIGFALRLLPSLSRQPEFVGLSQYFRLLFVDTVFWKALLHTALLWLVPILFAITAACGLSRFFSHAGKRARFLSLGVALLTGLAAYLVYLLLNSAILPPPSTWPEWLLTAALIFFTAFGCCSGFFCLSGIQSRPWYLILQLAGIFLALNLTSAMPSGLSAPGIPSVGQEVETLQKHLSDYAAVRPNIFYILSQQFLYLSLALFFLVLVWLADRGVTVAQGKRNRER